MKKCEHLSSIFPSRYAFYCRKKYIDERLNRNESGETTSKQTNLSVEDQILMRAADKLRGYKSKANDELLSAQMLVGIPEADLPLRQGALLVLIASQS